MFGNFSRLRPTNAPRNNLKFWTSRKLVRQVQHRKADGCLQLGTLSNFVITPLLADSRSLNGSRGDLCGVDKEALFCRRHEGSGLSVCSREPGNGSQRIRMESFLT